MKLLQHTVQDADTKTSIFKRDFFVFIPENWLVIYYGHRAVTDSRC